MGEIVVAWYALYWEGEETLLTQAITSTVTFPEFKQDQNAITLSIPKPPSESLIPEIAPGPGTYL